MTAREQAAQEVADLIAVTVVNRMHDAYPEPMRHASGGLAKTLRGLIVRETRIVVLNILDTPPEDRL